MNPDYPIYVISKGRWKNLLTCRALEYMEVPYKIVVEEQEFNNYTNYVNKSKILVLPKNIWMTTILSGKTMIQKKVPVQLGIFVGNIPFKRALSGTGLWMTT